MKIYHIAMAKSDETISGGERCMIELVKYLRHKKRKNIIITTQIGKRIYEQAGLRSRDPYIDYLVAPLSGGEAAYHMFIAWIICALRGVALVRKVVFQKGDIVMSHSAFFPDYLTANSCKRKNDSPRVYYWNHLIPPLPFYGYEGQFTHALQVPRLNVVFFYINRFVFRKFFLARKDIIITVSEYYKRILQTKYPNNYIYAVRHYGGAESYFSYSEKKNFDVVWLGRFHAQKGLLQFADIVSRIKSKLPNVRALVIGGGNEKILQKFQVSILEKHLENTITYLGTVLDRKKIMHYLSQSKVFLMTSTYESFGQVSLEAMKRAVPVVAYDLPPFEPLRKGMVVVPILDNSRFSESVIKLLTDKEYYKKQVQIAYNHSKKFSWGTVGRQVYALLRSNYVQE